MHRLILAHVPGDEAAAQQLSAVVEALCVCVRSPNSNVQVSPGSALGIVWSAKAAASPVADRLAHLAAMAPSAILFRTDDAAPSADLAAQRLINVLPHATAEELASAVRLAQRAQPRRAPARPRRESAAPEFVARAASEVKASYGRMFMSGMTRGFASSVAVLSLGAGAAVGVQEKAGLLGISDSFAHPFEPANAHVEQLGVTEDAEENRVALALPGLISDAELAHQANALRQAAAAQRAQIFARLNFAEQQLDEARARTDAVIARLDAISTRVDHANFAAAAPSVLTAAPAAAPSAPQLAQAPAHAEPVAASAQQQADLAPVDDIYALTRYVDRIAEPAQRQEDAKLGLWSPT